MSQQIGMTTLVVRDYDEAIGFYVNKLGFSLVEDTLLGSVDEGAKQSDNIGLTAQIKQKRAKRWVIVAPADSNTQLLLARASTPEEVSRVGNQTGGRVSLFLFTEDFWRDHKTYTSRGVEFQRGEPRVEAYGTVAVFSDLYGNLWDLIERA